MDKIMDKIMDEIKQIVKGVDHIYVAEFYKSANCNIQRRGLENTDV